MSQINRLQAWIAVAALLRDGRVLVVGPKLDASAELYDPATGIFSRVAPNCGHDNGWPAGPLT